MYSHLTHPFRFIRSTVAVLLATFFFTACQKENELLETNQQPPVANAGPSKSIQLPVNTVTMNGTGTSTNGAIVAYLWSSVSGPNVPVFTHPGSATTTVSNLIAGTYLVQLMVTDAAGLTGVDTATITVTPSPQQTITLQPATNPNELNFALLGSANASSLDVDLDAAAWTVGGVPIYIRGGFRFDLSAIPAGATILSAKLTLYSNPNPINGDLINANSGTNNSMYIRRLQSAWTGATATWQTQPAGSVADQLVIPHTNQNFLDLVDLDVTAHVAAMHPANNFGWMLYLQNETAYNIRQFCSSRHPIAAKRPKLVVVYQ